MCLCSPRPATKVSALIRAQRTCRCPTSRVIYASQRMQYSGTAESFGSFLLRGLKICASNCSLFARSARIVAIALDLALPAAITGAAQRFGRRWRDG